MRLHTWQKLQFESACGYDHIWVALCNDLVRRLALNLFTKVSDYLGHTLRGVQMAERPWPLVD